VADEEQERSGEFRRRAQECLELAKQASHYDHRARLTEMAKGWLALAQQEEGKPESNLFGI